MKFAAPSRREVGVRTVFNILGPFGQSCAYQLYCTWRI